MEELILFIPEADRRKQEKVRRSRRRDAHRQQLVRVFVIIASIFWVSLNCVIDIESQTLHPMLLEYTYGWHTAIPLFGTR